MVAQLEIPKDDTLLGRMLSRGVIVGPSHFVLGDGFGNPGRHSNYFVSAERFYESIDIVRDCARAAADRVRDWDVRLIVTPDDQSLPVARLIARHLAGFYRVPSIECISMESSAPPDHAEHVLIHDDVVNRGRQARDVIEWLRESGDEIVGISCLVRRIEADFLDGLRISAVLDRALPTFPADDCPLCRDHIPVNPEHGKGRFFLAQLG